MPIVVRCEEVIDAVTAQWRGRPPDRLPPRVARHLAGCASCREYGGQMRLVGRAVECLEEGADDTLPPELEARLLGLARWHCRNLAAEGARPVAAGLGEEHLAPGDHVAYFWESERDFARAVGFLEVGLRAGEHGIVLGYDDANARVLDELRRRALDPESLIERRRLVVAGGRASRAELLEGTAAQVRAALGAGAPLVRLLGNLGWGRPGWASDEDILAFESEVTEVARGLPLVVVCMYDVAALPGRLLLAGGLETHPLTMRRGVLRRNEHHVAGAVLGAR
jgi:hypothetical protein